MTVSSVWWSAEGQISNRMVGKEAKERVAGNEDIAPAESRVRSEQAAIPRGSRWAALACQL